MNTSEKIIEKLSGLVGSTIVHIDAVVADGQSWPVLVVENLRNQTFQLEIASDQEGNGPGHVFLALLHGNDFEDCFEIFDQNSWNVVDSL